MKYTKKICKAPDTLTDFALDWWERFVPILYKKYNLEEIDLINMEFMAICYDNFHKAYQRLKDTDYVVRFKNGSDHLSQFHTMMQQNLSAYNNLAKEYGLTPLSKTKLTVATNETQGIEGLEEYIKTITDGKH